MSGNGNSGNPSSNNSTAVELRSPQGIILDQNEPNPFGEKFDHSTHEAVKYEQDVTGNTKDGTVTNVLEKGYSLGGKLIKPAKVIVAGTQ